jgi:hypothetical protein
MLLAIVVKTVYIIILVIFIIVFALLHFFLRKINAKKKNNRLTWIPAKKDYQLASEHLN